MTELGALRAAYDMGWDAALAYVRGDVARSLEDLGVVLPASEVSRVADGGGRE